MIQLREAAMLHALARTVSRRAQKRYLRQVIGKGTAETLDDTLRETLEKYGESAINDEIKTTLASVWVWREGGELHVRAAPVGAEAPAPDAELIEAAMPIVDLPELERHIRADAEAAGIVAVSGESGHDEWIVGEGLEPPGRWYVIHAHFPPFLAECDDEERWTLTQFGGLMFTAEERADWIDRAAQVIDDYDVRSDRRAMREQMADNDDQVDNCLDD